MKHLIAIAAFAVLASPAAAQLDFVAVDIGPSPDTIYYFDMDSPATGSATATATLAGNFVRGIDLVAETTGWYVATSSLSGSPTGFYRLDDGVSTQVGPLPFTSTTDGGLSLSQLEDFLYWVADPPTGDDTLLRIDFNGTITTLAPITHSGGGAVSIIGIAVDPLTGILYAVDSGTDSLYTIDPVSGATTLVGPLGFAFSGLGGLDFSLDGTNRLFFVHTASCRQLDPATGVAGPIIGNIVNGNTSAIASVPSRVTMHVTSMAIGTPFSATLTGGNGGDGYGMLVALAPSYVPFAPFGILRIDLASALEFSAGSLSATGSASFTATLPSDPGLQGLPLFFQSYAVSTLTLPSIKATNPVSQVIQ